MKLCTFWSQVLILCYRAQLSMELLFFWNFGRGKTWIRRWTMASGNIVALQFTLAEQLMASTILAKISTIRSTCSHGPNSKRKVSPSSLFILLSSSTWDLSPKKDLVPILMSLVNFSEWDPYKQWISLKSLSDFLKMKTNSLFKRASTVAVPGHHPTT